MTAKERSAAWITTTGYHYGNGLASPPTGSGIVRIPGVLEKISSGSGRNRENDCVHYEHVVTVSPYTGHLFGRNGEESDYVDTLWWANSLTGPSFLGQLPISVPVRDYSTNDFRDRILMIDDSSNLLDFVRELGNPKALFESVRSPNSLRKSASDAFKGISDNLISKARSGRSSNSSAPNRVVGRIPRADRALLTSEYVVKPFLDDLRSLKKTLLNFQKDYNRIRDSVGKPSITYLTGSSPYRSDIPFKGQSDVDCMLSIQGTVQYRARARTVVRRIGSWSSTGSNPFDHMIYLIDRSGFGDVFSTAWEAVPYSFIVDYYANVSGSISKIDPVFTNMSFESSDFVRSRKLEAEFSVRYTDFGSIFRSSAPTFKDSLGLTGHLKHYVREPFNPSGPFDNLSISRKAGVDDLRKGALVTSLATSKFLK